MLLEGDAVTLEDNGSVSWISTSWHAFINFGDLMPKNSIRDVFARERPGITRKLRASQRARSQEGTEKILEVYLFEFSTTDFIDLPIHLSCLPSLSTIDFRHFLRFNFVLHVSSVAAVVLRFLISDNQTIAVPY